MTQKIKWNDCKILGPNQLHTEECILHDFDYKFKIRVWNGSGVLKPEPWNSMSTCKAHEIAHRKPWSSFWPRVFARGWNLMIRICSEFHKIHDVVVIIKINGRNGICLHAVKLHVDVFSLAESHIKIYKGLVTPPRRCHAAKWAISWLLHNGYTSNPYNGTMWQKTYEGHLSKSHGVWQ